MTKSRKIRVQGILPGEKDYTILGYVSSLIEERKIVQEYVDVFSNITFRVKLVTMISQQKADVINALMGALLPFGLSSTHKIK